MKIDISQEDFGALAVCAIRYCHGRQTYMPSLVQDICKAHLKEFSDNDIGVMLNDCEWMNDFDYGSPTIDKPRWLAWHEALKTEKERRNAED